MALSSFLFLSCFSALVSSTKSATQRPLVLSRQCWHERSFSTVILQSTNEGSTEHAVPINSPPHASQRQSDYHPWTHPPVCTEVLETQGSVLCVYTNASFSEGRGISIVTTPQLASHFSSLPAFQNPTALQNVNIICGNWSTQEFPGKGVGMVAKTLLQPKDRITAYTPALIALLESELSTLEREKLYRTAINQLPERTRENYLQLAYVYGHPDIRIQDIVKANTFQLEVGGHNHLAVFPETSRLNHACDPNAQYYLNPSLLTHFVHATRPIASGEEITISYTSPLEDTATRNQHLQNGFHFTCSCPRCTRKISSDKTLSTIRLMEAQLNEWSDTRTAAPQLAEQLIEMYRNEGLEGFLDVPYGFAALAYNSVGDVENARKFAELAKDVMLVKDGVWTPNLDMWDELVRAPERHWSYKRRLQN